MSGISLNRGSSRRRTTMNEDEKFREWRMKVDWILLKRIGMSSEDLGDVDYWGMFQDGYSPSEAAKAAIKANS